MTNGADHSDPLHETLRDAQRLGFFGAAPIEAAVTHAHSFVHALAESEAGVRIADIGSGGGLPGLVIATERPDVSLVMIDRRQKRTDFLERAVRRLSLSNASVRCGDVSVLAREIADGVTPAFDVVTARGFGPPDVTLRVALSLVHEAGSIIISEPPSGDRWDPQVLDAYGLSSERIGAVRRFHTSPGV